MDSQQPKLQGEIERGRVADLVQFLATQEQMTGMLELRSESHGIAKIWFDGGILLAAEAENLTDEDAIPHILRFDDGEFAFREVDKVPARRITRDAQGVILDAIRIIDEEVSAGKEAPLAPPPTSTKAVTPGGIKQWKPKPKPELPPEPDPEPQSAEKPKKKRKPKSRLMRKLTRSIKKKRAARRDAEPAQPDGPGSALSGALGEAASTPATPQDKTERDVLDALRMIDEAMGTETASEESAASAGSEQTPSSLADSLRSKLPSKGTVTRWSAEPRPGPRIPDCVARDDEEVEPPRRRGTRDRRHRRARAADHGRRTGYRCA